MFEKLYAVKERILNLPRNEKGAVAFEYVLIIDGVSAVIVAALAVGAPSLFDSVVTSTCSSLDGVVPGFVSDGLCGALPGPKKIVPIEIAYTAPPFNVFGVL